jgi:hypothetical protein
VAACPICGFDPHGLAPLDGIAALRSFRRRFAELVPDDHPEAEAMRAVVKREADAAASEMAAAGEALRRVLVSDEPSLDDGNVGATTTNPTLTNPADLASVAEAVAELAASARGEQWRRTGRRGGEAVTALDLLADAVHAGVHHLRLAERAL